MNLRPLIIPGLIALVSSSLPAQQASPNAFSGSILDNHELRIVDLETRVSKLENLTEAEGAPIQQTGEERRHVIQPGDSLYRIAQQYGLHVVDLAAANGITVNQTIHAGKTLLIPAGGSSPSTPRPQPQPDPGPKPVKQPIPVSGKTTEYVVRQGDTLTQIASRNGVTVNQLIQVNQLSNPNALKIGQKLIIQGSVATSGGKKPASEVSRPSDFHYYDVMPGDTLQSIASTFFTTTAELRKLNRNLPADGRVKTGDQIVVPTKRYFEYLEKQRKSIS